MVNEMSWEEELQFAEDYANCCNQFPKEYMEGCLRNAIAKSKRDGKDISKEVLRIRQIYDERIKKK